MLNSIHFHNNDPFSLSHTSAETLAAASSSFVFFLPLRSLLSFGWAGAAVSGASLLTSFAVVRASSPVSSILGATTSSGCGQEIEGDPAIGMSDLNMFFSN